MNAGTPQHPLCQLPPEDLELVLQFVLASGSLKALGRQYGVSYPTIRARLDRLIARLEQLCQGRAPDPVVEALATLVERGELSIGGARQLRDLYLQQKGVG